MGIQQYVKWKDTYDNPADWEIDTYEEPPLYPDGKIAGMSDAALIAERDRQDRIHDAAVDRCEEINSPTIETATARANICEAEIKRRSIGYSK